MKTLKISLVMMVLACIFSVPAMAASISAYTRTNLYENMAQLENVNSSPFVSAAKYGAEKDGLKDCDTQQIGVTEYRLQLSGKKLDEESYIWVLTENGKIISVELITKK